MSINSFSIHKNKKAKKNSALPYQYTYNNESVVILSCLITSIDFVLIFSVYTFQAWETLERTHSMCCVQLLLVIPFE